MEKRRVAPGWLDVDQTQHMLVPKRVGGEVLVDAGATPEPMGDMMDVDPQNQARRQGDGGEELDRAFGGLGLR